MGRRFLISLLPVLLPVLSFAASPERPLFGPVKYEVKERYGAENRYRGSFNAAEGLFAVKLQNGDKWPERPDFLEFTLNGVKLLKEARYEHPVIACLVRLKKENSFEIVLKDAKPSGMKRPVPTPKFTYVSVLRPPLHGIEGAFGADTWENLVKYLEVIKGIKSAEAAQLAAAAAGLQNELAVRTDAVRKLSEMKEPSARDFMLHLFSDILEKPEVRAEAALGLSAYGDPKYVPLLVRELINPDDTISSVSARALSFYKEEDTRGPLMKLIENLDSMRRGALMRALADGGWKPVGVLADLAKGADAYVANTAIELLGGLMDPRATDVLLELIEAPGERNVDSIIASLGRSKDSRAVDALIKMANDAERRAGREVAIGDALVELGDQRGADAISLMIKKAPNDMVKFRLMSAYRKLTGRPY